MREVTFFFKKREAQITIFIIVGILIVAVVSLFFLFKNEIIGTISGEKVPPVFEPLHESFLSCIEGTALTGIQIMESQAGYIYTPDFEPGSKYMPFSSQFDFLGTPVPYWYYVSGNNLQKEQIPTKKEMEEQLATFVEEKIFMCNLDFYREQGFKIIEGEPEAEVVINPASVDIALNMNMDLKFQDESAFVRKHSVRTESRLGRLYDSAKKIYDYEQKNLFLEKYAVDTLRMYAPVDGVEITCSPKIWNAQDVFSELRKAIEANTLALLSSGNDYTLGTKEDKYFIVDAGVEEEVRFMNSRNWPSAFEVNPSQGEILLAKPVGTQEGLGILGFCYVPYHFVYNIRYPVLIQIFSGEEIFQFPMAVIIQGNKPREAVDAGTVFSSESELCKYQNTPEEIYTYDSDFNPVQAEISYECLGSSCFIGKTSEDGFLLSDFPQCVNGFVNVRAEGFEDARYLFSTTESGRADIILDKLYDEKIELFLDNTRYGGKAIVSFVSDSLTKTISYPEQKDIQLSAGQYSIQVYIYADGSIKFPATKTEKCMDIPQEGFFGVLGMKKEKCFVIETPEEIVTNILAGGGTQEYYILESELAENRIIEIKAESFPKPDSLEKLGENYDLFETKNLEIVFT